MSHAITLSQLPERIDPGSELLAQLGDAKMAMSLTTPLIAYQMFQCDFYFTEDPRMPTAGAMATPQGNKIAFNVTFWQDILQNPKQRAFLLMHETLHIFLQHGGRQYDVGYDPELWNIATDYYINLVCGGAYKAGSGEVRYSVKNKKYMEMPTFMDEEIGLYDERFLGMDSDEIYHKLLDENDGDAEKAKQANGGGKRPGDEGGGQVPFDAVADSMDTVQESKNKKTSAAAIAKAENEKSIGDNEMDMVNQLVELFAPKISWREHLEDCIQVSTKERETYNRLSRRTDPHSDIFLPSLTGETIKVVFGVDTSGSMSENDLQEAMGELKGILDQFEGWKVDFVTCDTKHHLIGAYDSEDGDDFTDVDLNLIGGGGTDMAPIVRYAIEEMDQGEELNACIIVTDGFIPDRVDNEMTDECEFVFVVTSGGNHDLVLENAKVIFMDDIGK